MKTETKVSILIQRIDPLLAERYAEKVLVPKGIESLAALDTELSSLERTFKKLRRIAIILLIFLILSGIVTIITAKFLLLILLLIIVSISLIMLSVPPRIFFTKYIDRLHCRKFLLDEAVKELNQALSSIQSPFSLEIDRYYSEASVRTNLECYAIIILELEERFNQTRLQEHCDLKQIRYLSDEILKIRERMDHAKLKAELFGLRFKKSELFQQAEQELVRSAFEGSD